jgi:metallo-beta-lactamase family protein
LAQRPCTWKLTVRAALSDIVARTIARGGVVMVPTFAVGRAQTLLFLLSELMESGVVPRVPVFMNSPMATAVTELASAHIDEQKLTTAQWQAMSLLALRVGSTEEIAHSIKSMGR